MNSVISATYVAVMEHLNLNLLRALAALLEDRNVTQAAYRLHLTQSAMSRQLRQLREFFDDPLLIREGQDYLLSTRARQLLPKVQGILSDVDCLREENEFNPAACQRRFRFACTDYVAQFIFPNILKRLQREAPSVDIIFEMWRPEWIDQLGQLPLDFISTMAPNIPENLSSITLGQDNPVCLMASDHPLAHQQAPSLSDLLAYPFVHLTSGGDKDTFFDQHLQAQQLSRRVLFEVPFFSAGFQVVATSEALMILPAHIAQNATTLYPLTHRTLPMATPEYHYHLCWHQLHHQDKAHSWLRHCIADELKSSMYTPFSS